MGSCKILITSRFESVCLAVGARVCTVGGLTKEEIGILLGEKVGNSVDPSDLCPLASYIAEICRGLPLDLIFVSRMLEVMRKHWPGMRVAQKEPNPALLKEIYLHETKLIGASIAQDMSMLLPNLSVYQIVKAATSLKRGPERSKKSFWSSTVLLPPNLGRIKAKNFGHVYFEMDHDIFSVLAYLSRALVELDLQNTDIHVLPREMKRLINLRLLNLTNCRNLQIIEPGIISSLVRLEELYMLGSFSGWEAEKEGKRVGNASIAELEFLPDLTALQIEIRNENIIPKNSHIWSRLALYVILTAEELKCRFQESPHISFPAINLDDYNWQFRRAIDLHLPNLTSLVVWLCVMLRRTEYLRLAGDGSKNALDELIPDGFKLLKQVDIVRCSTMECFLDGVGQVLPTSGLLPVLESLYLEDLPLFVEIFRSQLPGGLFRELRNLKLYRLPALLHVCRNPTHSVSLSNLRSVHILDCPKLRSLFSLSMARAMIQLEEIKIEYCEMMEEIFSEERLGDGTTSNRIVFFKLNFIELNNLPNLTGFCKNVRIEFPQLREMRIQSLQKLRTFCPAESNLPYGGYDDNGMQFLFTEKIAFGSLKKLEIIELDSVTSIWCHHPNTSLFSELEILRVMSSGTLSNLFSHSIGRVLVQLKRLIVEDCCMMQEVVAEDAETGQPEKFETLFPQLKKLKLRRLPILERFCQMINGLELPSLEDLTLYNCPGMKEFSGGQISMPMLKCVKRDYSKYKIDGINYTVDHLLNEKHLFDQHPGRLSSQYEGTEVEEFLGEEVLKGSMHSDPERSIQTSGGNRGANLQIDVNPQSVCSTSKNATMTEGVDTDPPERYPLERGEERWDEDVSAHCLSSGTKATEGQKEEISHEAKSKVSNDVVQRDERYVNDCILFCSGFPSDYIFTRDMLVCQWIAQGSIKLGEDEIMEEVYIQCFDTLLNLQYIVLCGCDYYFDHTMYKVGDKMKSFIQKQRLEPKFRKDLDSTEIDVAKIEHLSLAFKEFDHIDFGIIKQCSGLRVLMIHQCYGCEVKSLPSDLFLKLKDLKILNLSHTDIVVLPSSVVNLKELQYLDISETPIVSLPNSIHCLGNLQTLKLDGCSDLNRLPECVSELINLQHLILDVRQVQSMPKGIGKLSKLRTLGAFYVRDEDGYRIGELKNMNNLKGLFRILHLECVTTKEEAAEACLCNKQDLKKVNLCWNDFHDEKHPNEEGILQSLQPPFGIQELTIMFYSGGVLPSWISNPSFSELVSIKLYWCNFWSSLPSLGKLPSLKVLKIVKNNEVMEINNFFCRKQTDQHRVAFPKLEKLSFVSMNKLEKWTGIENGDFPSLRSLVVESCPKLVALPFLSHLNSLLHMEIRSCQEVSCLPEGGLPATLGCLMISHCPKLQQRCCNEQCEDWAKVAHVRKLYFN